MRFSRGVMAMAGLLLVVGCNGESSPTEVVQGEPSLTVYYTLGCEPHPECARPPNADTGDDEQQKIDEAIEYIRDQRGCEEMANWLADLLADGRIRVYDHDDGDWGDIHNPGDEDDAAIDLWNDTVDDVQELPNTLSHEYGHHRLNGGTESDADNYMSSCDGQGGPAN